MRESAPALLARMALPENTSLGNAGRIKEMGPLVMDMAARRNGTLDAARVQTRDLATIPMICPNSRLSSMCSCALFQAPVSALGFGKVAFCSEQKCIVLFFKSGS